MDIPIPAPRLVPAAVQRVAHSRESSAEKLQQQHQGAGSVSVASPSAASASSAGYPQLHTSASRTGLNSVIERIVDPKAAAYGHHRQTSIVHGIQHSRNGSLASSSSSPLSPQMIAAAGAVFASERSDAQAAAFSRLEGEATLPSAALSPASNLIALPTLPASRPGTAMSGANAMAGHGPASTGGGASAATSLAPGGAAPDRTASAAEAGNPPFPQPQRKLERMQSGKLRQEHSHQTSHSRHYKDDQKTVGEYALHVLFTSVSDRLVETPGAPFPFTNSPSSYRLQRRNSTSASHLLSVTSPWSNRSAARAPMPPLTST